MTFKRSRMGDSSIFASDVSLPALLHSNSAATSAAGQSEQQPMSGKCELIKQPYNPKKIVKQVNAQTIDQPRRPTIFTIETTDDPVIQPTINVVGGLQSEPTEGFCYYCNKKFRPSMNLFMYRGLAFCKAGCRRSQEFIDERDAKLKNQLAQK